MVQATSQQEFSDADFRIVDNADQSKKLAFQISGITAATTRTWTVPDADVTVASFIAGLLDDTTATAALATLGITTGNYTPTLFNTTNIDASTAVQSNYVRIGNIAIVFGVVVIDPTSASVATELGMSLPVASALAGNDVGGAAAASGFNEAWGIVVDATNDRVKFQTVVATNTNHNVYYIFGYLVV